MRAGSDTSLYGGESERVDVSDLRDVLRSETEIAHGHVRLGRRCDDEPSGRLLGAAR